MTQKKKTQKSTNKTTIPPKFKGFVRAMWITVLSGFLFVIALFVLVSFSKLPDTQELENPKYEYATQIFTTDNQELGRYFRFNRDWVTYEELSPHLVKALISTEDERYMNHSGIDMIGTLRAVVFLGRKGGASTITQQLAKLFFTKKSNFIVKRVWQKMQEWVIAIELEKRYTKEEIIAMYLNKFSYIYNSYGISAASKTYFGKSQFDLNTEEAAMLIGMLKNPVAYNPRMNPKNAEIHRMVVLNQMRKKEHISQAEYDSLRVLPLGLNFKKETHDTGPAPYFRAELTKWLRTLLNSGKIQKPGGGNYDFYQDGLKIYTTIDMKMQVHAEREMEKHMQKIQQRYFEVWNKRDPWTYDAEVNQKRIRKESLNSLIRNSEIYGLLRDKYLADIYNDLRLEIPDSRFRDIDVIRMIKEDKKEGYLPDLVKRKIISKKQSNTYRRILTSESWPILKEQWNKLEVEAKSSFNKKRKMSVFAYNEKGSKEMTMTPLDSIKYHRMHLQAGSLSINPINGHVKAWIGGVGFKYFKYDHIRSRRQVGSTFKPIIYTTAIFNQGISPCQKVEDVQYVIQAGDPDFKLIKTWKPQNARGKFSGEKLTLYEGLHQSLNSVSVWLIKQLGNVDLVRNLADKMGIDKSKIPKQPSICLGSADLTVMEMTGAYTVFANNGVYNKPVFVTRIEDRNGKVLYRAVPEQRKVLPEDYNYVMVDMLQYAAKFIAPSLESQVGGKTGTTNDYVDGWFVGITPELVVGTWVGGEDPWIRFLSLGDGQGGVMARPFFVNYIKSLENDPEVPYDKTAKFKIPEGELTVETDCNLYESLYGSTKEAPDNRNKNNDELEEEGIEQ
jgi:penicillin-binding protein 1A